MRPAQRLVVLGVIVAVTVVPALADDKRGGELGILLGAIMVDQPITGNFDGGEEFTYAVGLRGGTTFAKDWGWYVDFLYSDVTTEPLLGDATMYTGRTGFDIMLSPDRRARWFMTPAVGYTRAEYGNVPREDWAFGSLGIGQRIQLGSGNLRFRWELRIDRSFSSVTAFEETVTNALLLGGIVFGPGGHPPDDDLDGVVNYMDACPGTPAGAVVDPRGCPLDSDDDGVPDGLDRCPNTAGGWPVDTTGCPLDSDGDGVPDGADDCPDTPPGVVVDTRGCPVDSDGDGVPDGIDRCPDTPVGAVVDEYGCPLDTDGDGVPDGIDRCPDTPAGAVVDEYGCTKDSDGDGVPDHLDECPDTPSGVEVDSRGCPLSAPLFTEVRTALVLEGVKFELNSATLTPDSRTRLDRVARSLREWPAVQVEVAGFTDSSGAAAYNRKLSDRRANAVRKYLVDQGVSASNLVARGYGEDNPIADNGTAEGRARNRRVVLRKLE